MMTERPPEIMDRGDSALQARLVKTGCGCGVIP